MGILDRLFGRREPRGSAAELVFKFLDEVRGYRCEDDPRFVAITAADPELQAAIAVELCKLFLPESAGLRRDRGYLFRPAVVTLWNALCADRELPFTETQLVALVDGMTRGHVGNAVALTIERAIRGPRLTPGLRAALEVLAIERPGAISDSMRALLPGLEIGEIGEIDADGWPAEEVAKRVDPVEAWLSRLDTTLRADWTALLEHAGTAASKPRPTQRFIRESEPLIAAIGQAQLAVVLAGWLESVSLEPADVAVRDKVRGIPDDQREVLKGLLWAAGPGADAVLVSAIAAFAERCWKKIPDHGPASAKLGNASLYVLGRARGTLGVAALARVATRVRYASARRQVERALDDAAARAGVTRDDLEELSVPSFDLGDGGAREQALGGYTAELVLRGTSAELRWRNPKGATLKTVPKAVKDDHREELKALRRDVKDLTGVATGQAARLEGFWLRDRTIALGDLRERYLEHPVVGLISRRLLWSIDGSPALFRGGRFLALGEPVAATSDARTRLWHPLECASVDDIVVWRDWLSELGIAQPFAQLYRDVYRADESRHGAAAFGDERFAGHVLLQRALREQCQRSGWRYQLQGYWDSANAPTLDLERHDLVATFDADPVEHQGDDYMFEYLVTGAVRFYARPADGAGLYRAREVASAQIEPLVFSEVMRSVGAIVAASTIAVDLQFDRTGPGASFSDYWQRGAWGELAPAAESRLDVVASILPRTTLRECAELDGRWLVVRGARGQHRIHLGSGLIRSDESGEPVEVRLTTAAKRDVEAVFLPFEGDAMLVKILARAFALAK